MIRALALAALVLAVSACGGDDEEPLTVFAAASLTDVFQELSPDARFNFAGSDQLATQIREGAKADVYAAASPRYADVLLEEGLIEEPLLFATNRLVLLVPDGNPEGIESLEDLDRDGLLLVIGAEGVPVGDYTRTLLEAAGRSDLLDRVVSNEEDVRGVVAKVLTGNADAGFVYATDARVGGSLLQAIELPQEIQPPVRYPIGIVKETDRRGDAEAFVELLLSERGRRLLRQAGFGIP
jgi:molybdate transport system substrate-binding protein